jgi:hypothetical protein
MWGKCKTAIEEFGINIRDAIRSTIGIALGIGIVSTGWYFSHHIARALAVVCERGIINDYCDSIDGDLAVLRLIAGIAGFAVPCALAGFWYYHDRSSGRDR